MTTRSWKLGDTVDLVTRALLSLAWEWGSLIVRQVSAEAGSGPCSMEPLFPLGAFDLDLLCSLMPSGCKNSISYLCDDLGHKRVFQHP